MKNPAVNPAFLRTIKNANVFDSFVKAESVISRHERILCSLSGGSDSDIVLDLVHRVGDKAVTYIWINTGIEYEATKEHISFLERKYGVTIQQVDAVKPIPTCCRDHGVPFVSKYVSEMISRLQAHGFQWEDEPYPVLLKRYLLRSKEIENIFDNSDFVYMLNQAAGDRDILQEKLKMCFIV